jgi:hypothetical protein
MSMLSEISKAVEMYRDDGLQCILIHPERAAELYREMDAQRWWNNDTNKIVDGLPFGKKDFTDPEGAIIRVAEVPVFEDRHLIALWTSPPDQKRILFFTRRLQDDGTNLLQGWTECP